MHGNQALETRARSFGASPMELLDTIAADSDRVLLDTNVFLTGDHPKRNLLRLVRDREDPSMIPPDLLATSTEYLSSFFPYLDNHSFQVTPEVFRELEGISRSVLEVMQDYRELPSSMQTNKFFGELEEYSSLFSLLIGKLRSSVYYPEDPRTLDGVMAMYQSSLALDRIRRKFQSRNAWRPEHQRKSFDGDGFDIGVVGCALTNSLEGETTALVSSDSDFLTILSVGVKMLKRNVPENPFFDDSDNLRKHPVVLYTPEHNFTVTYPPDYHVFN